MHTLDYTIIIFILACFVGYGILQSFLNRTAADYFLGNRTVPWIVAMFSIVATETSVLTFISVPGLAYREDWFFLQLALGYIMGRILVSVLLLPRYFESGITSIYEVIGQRFGPGMQKSASAVFMITRILADGVRFLATGVVVQVVTGWPLWIAVCVIGGVTVLYTLLGGIRTIVWVDSVQFVLYLSGALISIFYLVHITYSRTHGTLSDRLYLRGKPGSFILTVFFSLTATLHPERSWVAWSFPWLPTEWIT